MYIYIYIEYLDIGDIYRKMSINCHSLTEKKTFRAQLDFCGFLQHMSLWPFVTAGWQDFSRVLVFFLLNLNLQLKGWSPTKAI